MANQIDSPGPNVCPGSGQTPIEYKSVLYSTKLSDVESRDLVWFWDNKIPDYGMSMLQGDPGVSKSFLGLDIAAHVSTGTSFIDCPNVAVEKGSVLILNGEDDPARIKERCIWAGADMDNIHLLKGRERYIDVRINMPDIQQKVDELNESCEQKVRLILFDPITSYLGTCKQNDNNEIRAALEPLSDFAVKNKLCILLINHMNKKQGDKYIYRGLGSMGFTAVCRSVWAVIYDQKDKEYRLMLPVKTNYSISASGLKYRIVDNKIAFDSEPIYCDIDEQDNEPIPQKLSKTQECTELLREIVPIGIENKVSSAEIKKQTDARGFQFGVVQKAKTKLGIEAIKSQNPKDGWFMYQKSDHLVLLHKSSIRD